MLEIVTVQREYTKKLPQMSERLEKIEHDVSTIRLATMGTSSDLNLIKIRTEKIEELITLLKDHETRLVSIETSN